MLFNSYLFILAFLPIAVVVFYQLNRTHNSIPQLAWLSLWSLVFYAYWNKIYLLLLLTSVFVNYGVASYLMQHKKKWVFVAGILFNVGVIAYFKYAGFILKNYNMLTQSHLSLGYIALPLGISFITFQKIGYLADVYSGKVTEKNFLRYLVFISFFPQLIAGPIVHYNALMSQFAKKNPKLLRWENLAAGIALFIIGLAKKIIIADTLASYADGAFINAQIGTHLSFLEAWIGVLAYTFQIYFDFSGYSDMAIGAARMFGIRLPVNFNSPYKAASFIEFWRCWHITLSQFLRDYVYIPLGGNRAGSVRKLLNLMATMLVGGLWHGAGWLFILWGGVHGALLALNHVWQNTCAKLGWTGLKDNILYKFVATGVTFFGVMMAWVFFRIQDRHAVKYMFNGLFGKYGFSIPGTSFLFHVTNRLTSLAITEFDATIPVKRFPILFLLATMLIVWLLPNSQQIIRYRNHWRGSLLKFMLWKPQPLYLLTSLAMFYVCLIFMADYNFQPFKYFAF